MRRPYCTQAFFSVVKKCFENKSGFVPYFGELDEDEPTEEEQKLEQAELKGFAIGHSFSKKKFYEGVFIGFFFTAALATTWIIYFLTNAKG